MRYEADNKRCFGSLVTVIGSKGYLTVQEVNLKNRLCASLCNFDRPHVQAGVLIIVYVGEKTGIQLFF